MDVAALSGIALVTYLLTQAFKSVLKWEGQKVLFIALPIGVGIALFETFAAQKVVNALYMGVGAAAAAAGVHSARKQDTETALTETAAGPAVRTTAGGPETPQERPQERVFLATPGSEDETREMHRSRAMVASQGDSEPFIPPEPTPFPSDAPGPAVNPPKDTE